MRPLVNDDAGLVKLRPMFCTASTTKINEMRVEKISSVNLVRYLTKLDADVTELIEDEDRYVVMRLCTK